MNQPLKVLLVQRRSDQGQLLQSLQHDSNLKFKWQRVFSEAELRSAARDYAPTVVLSADDMHYGSARSVLDMLGILSKLPPELMIHEVCGDSAPWTSSAPGPAAAESDVAFSGHSGLGPSARPQLPALLRDTIDAVLMLDGNGWVTDLNLHAQRLLGIGVHKRPKAQAHLQDLLGALQAAGEGHGVSLPLVALNLDGLLLLNAAPGERHGDAALDLISSVVQPHYARCGFLARIDANQYLARLPHMSPPADAAMSVGGGRPTEDWPHAAASLHRVFGTESVDDTSVIDDPFARKAPEQIPRSSVCRAAKRVSSVAADLSEAIRRHALSVHFQPQYELPGGRGCGAEALVRWTLASGRELAPDLFIPIAESSGSIAELDAWVLQTACSSALRWRGSGAQRLTLAVNVPDRQIGPDYLRTLTETLRTSRFPSDRLELEIGEGVINSKSPKVKECLQAWKHLGVRIAVTHKAANYSSLDYLSRSTVDRLKLDKSLIHRMIQHPRTASTVRAIIALGSELRVDVIAEGVETPSQLAMLEDFNCPRAQGFLLARPMPAVQAQVVLAKPWGNFSRVANSVVAHAMH